jgi:hypothetical protein
MVFCVGCPVFPIESPVRAIHPLVFVQGLLVLSPRMRWKAGFCLFLLVPCKLALIFVLRTSCQIVAVTSRVFGNEWDGGVTVMSEQSQRSSHMPCG